MPGRTDTNCNSTMEAAEGTSAAKSNNMKARLLPEDYRPSSSTVIIGRGKKIKAHQGNRRLCDIVRSELPRYSTAGCKIKKSTVLVGIVERVRDTNEDRVGFVKQEPATGRWYEVTPHAARTTVAQAFRDTNHTAYKSSKQSKQRRRRTFKMSDEPSIAPGSKDAHGSHCPTSVVSLGSQFNSDSAFQQKHAASAAMIASSSFMCTSLGVTASQPLAMVVTPQRSASPSLQALGSPCGVPHALRGLNHFQRPYQTAGIEGAFQQDNSLTRMIFNLDTAAGFVDFPLHTYHSSSDCDDDGDDGSWADFFEPVPIAEHVLAKMGVEKGQTQLEDCAFDIFDIVSVADMKAAFSA
jgi:hypothetical protein